MYTDDSVTKDQSEDSAAYTVSISSLTTEVEEVTHALRWTASRGDSRTKSAIILTDSISLLQKMKSRMESPDWNCQGPTSTFENSYGCTALDMLESKETIE